MTERYESNGFTQVPSPTKKCYCTRIRKEHLTRDCAGLPYPEQRREYPCEHDCIMREILGH
jgi:hypothetical protein